MGLLELLKDRLSTSVIEKISGFLGETPDDISVALNAALPTMFAGIAQQTAKENGVDKVMDIIKEGGHTGDILDDLPTLLGNFDKTQLLVTIGSNIFNHFFGNNSNLLIEKIASLSGIRKTSASSLLGLSAPLVLGIIGKSVQRENLGLSGLKTLLDDQNEGISNALPPSIANLLPSKTEVKPSITATSTTSKKEEKTKKETKTKESSFGKIIPWILLLLLALAAAYYLRSCRIKPSEEVALTTDSLQVSAPATLPADEPADSTQTFSTETKTAENNAAEQAAESPATTPSVKQESKPVVETPVSKPKTETFSNSSSSSSSNKVTSSNAENESSARLSSSSIRTNRGSWLAVSGNTFRSSGSAEVNGSSSEVRALVEYLSQNPNRSVTIAPIGSGRLATDRAYALRDVLYEQGIDVSRINVSTSSRSGSGSVAVRIK